MKSKTLISIVGLVSLITLGSCNSKQDIPKYIGDINVKGVTYSVKVLPLKKDERELYLYEKGIDRSKDEWKGVSFAVDRKGDNSVDMIYEGPLVTILQHSDIATVQNAVADLDKLLRNMK
jgi:hypothetical protein